jgi:hypothetical protein
MLSPVMLESICHLATLVADLDVQDPRSVPKITCEVIDVDRKCV